MDTIGAKATPTTPTYDAAKTFVEQPILPWLQAQYGGAAPTVAGQPLNLWQNPGAALGQGVMQNPSSITNPSQLYGLALAQQMFNQAKPNVGMPYQNPNPAMAPGLPPRTPTQMVRPTLTMPPQSMMPQRLPATANTWLAQAMRMQANNPYASGQWSPPAALPGTMPPTSQAPAATAGATPFTGTTAADVLRYIVSQPAPAAAAPPVPEPWMQQPGWPFYNIT